MSAQISAQSIRILLVDDHETVRKSTKAMLGREEDLEVVGTAANGREAVERAQTLNPDVIVMDISMPELDGIRAAGKIRALGNAARIIIFSMHYDSALVEQARKNGASGYILKQEAIDALIPAIRAAYKGEISL